MTNWLCSREQIKAAANISGSDRNAAIDRIAEAVARQIEGITRRYYIPRTETRLYRWPPRQIAPSYVLWLDQDVLSVTTLQTQAQDASPTTISSSDYFLEPANADRYSRIEIDLSSTSAFESGDTRQRSISVAGSWGYSNDTVTAGTVASGLSSDATATSMVCSNGALIDVGDTLLIESEQVFITARANADSGTTTNGALNADKSQVSVTLADASGLNAGEVILIDSERMYIESISSNTLTVIRAYDGTTLAAHNTSTSVYWFRTLTIERGVNGTTAATHADSTAVTKYQPPLDIRNWAVAEAVAMYHQEQSGWGRVVGAGEGQTELSGRSLDRLRSETRKRYQRLRSAAI